MSPRALWLLTLALAVVCWAVLAIGYLSVAGQVHATSSDVRSAFDILGVPVVEAYRVSGRLGLRFGWGSAVLLLGPFALGMVASLVQVARYASSHRAAAVDDGG